jgi:hypothetical protein
MLRRKSDKRQKRLPIVSRENLQLAAAGLEEIGTDRAQVRTACTVTGLQRCVLLAAGSVGGGRRAPHVTKPGLTGVTRLESRTPPDRQAMVHSGGDQQVQTLVQQRNPAVQDQQRASHDLPSRGIHDTGHPSDLGAAIAAISRPIIASLQRPKQGSDVYCVCQVGVAGAKGGLPSRAATALADKPLGCLRRAQSSRALAPKPPVALERPISIAVFNG